MFLFIRPLQHAIKILIKKELQIIRKSSTFDTRSCLLHKLESGPKTKVELNRKDALKMYKEMQGIRRLENAIGQLYQTKKIRGFCHLYNGQEACAVGMFNAMRNQDAAISGYRVHGWSYLLSGYKSEQIISELLGKSVGLSKGKGGSMHMFTKRFFGGHGIVGAQVPIGAGLAFYSQYIGNNGICFTMYGDGAANQGQVFEAYNMAMLWKLPCIFVCENNGYAMGTSASRHAADTNFYTRGVYIPGISVDGMDVLAVREATKWAIQYVLEKGPIVIELQTYRYSGHSMSDPGTSYRTREEVNQIRQTKDPIVIFSDKLISSKLISDQELKDIDNDLKIKIGNSVKKCMNENELPLEELTADICRNSLEPLIRGVNPSSTFKHINKEPPP